MPVRPTRGSTSRWNPCGGVTCAICSRKAGDPASLKPPASCAEWPTRWPMPTAKGSCTATSSRPTSSWWGASNPRCWTSASPAWRTGMHRRWTARWPARPTTWRPSNCCAGRWTGAATCIRWAWCCSSCSPLSGPTPARRWKTSSGRFTRRRSRWLASSTPRCRPRCRPSRHAPWPAVLRTATRPRATCRASCASGWSRLKPLHWASHPSSSVAGN